MDWKEQPSILNHFLFIDILRVENGWFLKPTVLRFEPRLMTCFLYSKYWGPWPPLAPFMTPLVGSISTIGLTLMGHQMPWLPPAYIFNQADEFMWGILWKNEHEKHKLWYCWHFFDEYSQQHGGKLLGLYLIIYAVFLVYLSQIHGCDFSFDNLPWNKRSLWL